MENNLQRDFQTKKMSEDVYNMQVQLGSPSALDPMCARRMCVVRQATEILGALKKLGEKLDANE